MRAAAMELALQVTAKVGAVTGPAVAAMDPVAVAMALVEEDTAMEAAAMDKAAVVRATAAEMMAPEKATAGADKVALPAMADEVVMTAHTTPTPPPPQVQAAVLALEAPPSHTLPAPATHTAPCADPASAAHSASRRIASPLLMACLGCWPATPQKATACGCSSPLEDTPPPRPRLSPAPAAATAMGCHRSRCSCRSSIRWRCL